MVYILNDCEKKKLFTFKYAEGYSILYIKNENNNLVNKITTKLKFQKKKTIYLEKLLTKQSGVVYHYFMVYCHVFNIKYDELITTIKINDTYIY